MSIVEDLSTLADDLIRCAGRSKDAPFYTESGFTRKMRVSRRRERQLKLRELNLSEAERYLHQSAIESAIRRGHLTWKQEFVFRARILGETLEAIGCRLGISRQAVSKMDEAARKKVARAWFSDPYYGLREVYHKETRRGVR